MIFFLITSIGETTNFISEAHEQGFGRRLFDPDGQRAASEQSRGVRVNGQ